MKKFLKRTKKLMEQGVAGIVYGRNIIQHKKPNIITKVLMDMVHKGISVEEGLKILKA